MLYIPSDTIFCDYLETYEMFNKFKMENTHSILILYNVHCVKF